MTTKMIVSRQCPFCNTERTQALNVTREQYELWRTGTVIQLAMPHLTDDEREFIKTGICPEWFDQGEEE